MTGPNWRDQTIFAGDCLNIMREMNTGSVDLIYLDPPFNTQKNWKGATGSEAEGAAFKDTWSLADIDEGLISEVRELNGGLFRFLQAVREIEQSGKMAAYLAYLSIRLVEMRRVLNPKGSIYLHCHATAAAYLKVCMDAVFGTKSFRRECIWEMAGGLSGFKTQARNWVRAHDNILFYTVSNEFTFNKQRQSHNEQYLDLFTKTDADGRKYMLKNGKPRYLVDAMLKGKAMGDTWQDILPFQHAAMAAQNTGYPTQKPLALLERIIAASSNPGDMVMDPFCGSGTTCVAASKLQRQWTGIDIAVAAATLAQSRLNSELGMLSNVRLRSDVPEPRTN